MKNVLSSGNNKLHWQQSILPMYSARTKALTSMMCLQAPRLLPRTPSLPLTLSTCS